MNEWASGRYSFIRSPFADGSPKPQRTARASLMQIWEAFILEYYTAIGSANLCALRCLKPDT